ncbi:MAG: L,D-transpeptidase [Puniceicoccales bacterium]|jgi:hypothetical protein|nr:L,D-transpeptidase [Puniceicoccales bacterium]
MRHRFYLERINRICDDLKLKVTEQCIVVSIAFQEMYSYHMGHLEKVYRISTAKKGISQLKNSEGTPLGLHIIADKIGGDAPRGTVFIGRQSTKKIFLHYEDWETKGYITSRILRLQGLQKGYNLGENCDTYGRYIYIHGLSNEQKIGIPCTQGCIAMLNEDVIELFRTIDLNTLVLIHE